MRFLSLEAKARYQEVIGIIRQLEKLHLPVSDEIKSEKAALEDSLRAPNEDEDQLTVLARELSSLAKDIQLRAKQIQKTPSGGVKAPPKRLRVEFSDGTIIDENKAADTFIHAIRHIGLQRVSELPIKKFGHPLVSTRMPKYELPHYTKTLREIDGYFINTYSGTNQKAQYIKRIADTLQMDISVSIVD